ncbi:MAG TPA: OmpA family protein [Vicinamibacterales bacterium]|nr:OmpA family protein [Vicinamibacterales bacterium]
MRSARRIAVVLATLAATAIACGPKRVASPTRPGDTLVVLLPDGDSGKTGAAGVSNPAGSVDLAAPRDSTRVESNRAPGAVTTMTEADVKQLFGDALSALPPAPQQFTLNFRFESEVLTDESRALLADVIRAVRSRTLPEVLVVGHTDTMGTPQANIALGMRRAVMVRDLLVNAGLASAMIEVASHGEADLLVKTPDETPEPRNRRVDITVR